MDESSDLALSLVASIQASQPPAEAGITIPAEKIYNLAVRYLEMYNTLNKGRSTFVDNSRYIH